MRVYFILFFLLKDDERISISTRHGVTGCVRIKIETKKSNQLCFLLAWWQKFIPVCKALFLLDFPWRWKAAFSSGAYDRSCTSLTFFCMRMKKKSVIYELLRWKCSCHDSLLISGINIRLQEQPLGIMGTKIIGLENVELKRKYRNNLISLSIP